MAKDPGRRFSRNLRPGMMGVYKENQLSGSTSWWGYIV